MKNVNDKELASVLALSGPERYDYFVKQVADWEEIWTLRNVNGYVLVAGANEHPLVPVWPHRRFAETYAVAQWSGAAPVAISLERWLLIWTPSLMKDDKSVAIFPVPSGQGVVVTPDRLKQDLLSERDQYE